MAEVAGVASSTVEGGVTMSLLVVEDRLEEDMVVFKKEPIKRVGLSRIYGKEPFYDSHARLKDKQSGETRWQIAQQAVYSTIYPYLNHVT